MAIVKYVKQDGTGDYTDISAAFTDMLISGVAATGSITEYFMNVDGGTYYGSLTGYIPYSGSFNIIGSGTFFSPTTIAVSGEYLDSMSYNLSIENFIIDASGISSNVFSVPSGFGLNIKDTQVLESDYVVENSGSFFSDGLQSCGSGIGYGIWSDGYVDLNNTKLADFGTGVYGGNISIENSSIWSCYDGISTSTDHTTQIETTLIYDCENYTINSASGDLYIAQSTIDGIINGSDTLLNINTSIVTDSGYVIQGSYQTDSIVSNSCLYVSGYSSANISGSNNINIDPQYHDSSIGDYRLVLAQTTGSAAIEHVERPDFASGVEIAVETAQFKVFDFQGKTEMTQFLPYVYKQGSTILFSDYNKEIKFAKSINNRKYLFQLYANAQFSEYNVPTSPSFNVSETSVDQYPYDWYYESISTTQIDNDNSYMIPASIVNVESIANKNLGNFANDVLYYHMNISNIKAYNQLLYAGVAYDKRIAEPGRSVLWILDGGNQTLIKQNAFTGDTMYKYPLMCGPLDRGYIRPSGLIYVGVEGDSYRFILESDPNIEFLADGENGDFKWIPTHLNTKYDLRGLLTYKDSVFVTGTEYYEDIDNRSSFPSGLGEGRLLWYSNNDLFYNYIRRPETTNGPRMNTLASGNSYPTDLTMYEDGSLFVSDYMIDSGIYKYQLAYDYGMVQQSYDNETRVLLREEYEDVDL